MDTYIKILPSNGQCNTVAPAPEESGYKEGDLGITTGYMLLKVGSFQVLLYQVPGGEEPGHVSIQFPGYRRKLILRGCDAGVAGFPYEDKSQELYDEIKRVMTPYPGNGEIVTLKTRFLVLPESPTPPGGEA